jgi:hypothetical protein
MNAASHDCGGPSWGRGGHNRPTRGHVRSRGVGHGPSSASSRGGFDNNSACRPMGQSSDSACGQSRSHCQVCFKVGHTANICWYMFDEEYTLDDRVAAMANWYLDSSAIDHITRELKKLIMHERYNGGDIIRAANGGGLAINHIGKSVIPSSSRPLYLNQILHVPRAHKQLVSIHRFNLDNHTFIELHPYFFLIKDQVTNRVLLCGPCKGGFYPLHQLSSPTHQKILLSAIRSSPQ